VQSNKQSLKFRVLSAGAWASFIGVAGTVLRFGSSLIMTRLLFPDAFGLLAIGSVTAMLLNLFSDIGIRQFVINHERGTDRNYLDTIWGMSVARGAMIMAGAIIAAGAIAVCSWLNWFGPDSVYGHPDLPAIIALTSISSLIVGFKSPKLYVLERSLDLRKLAYVELASQLAGALVTILLAWLWRNVWSVVVGGYIASIATVLLSYHFSKWELGRLRWNREIVSEVVIYGRWILLSSATFVIASNLDRLMLGFWIAPAALGLYALALNIVGIVDGVASRPFMAVAMPAFSEVVRRGDGKLKTVYLKVRMPFDLLTVGAAGFVFATAQLMVEVLYDDRYAEAGRSLQILSFSLLFLRYNITATAHVSLGEPRTASISSVVKLLAIAMAIPIGHSLGGYYGAVWAISLHMLPATFYLFLKNTRHNLNDFWFEARMLAAWPAGFLLGWVANKLSVPVLSMMGWH
jgi:O-antigen/teichoic acid export membrane protein